MDWNFFGSGLSQLNALRAWAVALIDAPRRGAFAVSATGYVDDGDGRLRNAVLGTALMEIIREAAMPNSKDLLARAKMFAERADQARDPISRQHYIEMAAHYRMLAVEHQELHASAD